MKSIAIVLVAMGAIAMAMRYGTLNAVSLPSLEYQPYWHHSIIGCGQLFRRFGKIS
jgi:hypothetical protein